MPGYVYLIQDLNNDTYKVGVAKDINSRIKKLQTGNSTKLFLLDYYKCDYPFRLETMLHNRFKTYNVLNEWFALPQHEVIKFQNTCELLNNNIISLLSNPFFSKNLK